MATSASWKEHRTHARTHESRKTIIGTWIKKNDIQQVFILIMDIQHGKQGKMVEPEEGPRIVGDCCGADAADCPFCSSLDLILLLLLWCIECEFFGKKKLLTPSAECI